MYGKIVGTNYKQGRQVKMIGRVKYRGVVFGVHAVASTHNGHSVVRPICIAGNPFLHILKGKNISKCVGKAFKTELDENADEFGVKLATYRAYRMLVGEMKDEVQGWMGFLNGMQKSCCAEQDKLHNQRYPKKEVPAVL